MSDKLSIKVSGMSCSHCSGTVKKAVESVQGTSNVVVSLEQKKVDFELNDENQISKIKEAITSVGFQVEN